MTDIMSKLVKLGEALFLYASIEEQMALLLVNGVPNDRVLDIVRCLKPNMPKPDIGRIRTAQDVARYAGLFLDGEGCSHCELLYWALRHCLGRNVFNFLQKGDGSISHIQTPMKVGRTGISVQLSVAQLVSGCCWTYTFKECMEKVNKTGSGDCGSIRFKRRGYYLATTLDCGGIGTGAWNAYSC